MHIMLQNMNCSKGPGVTLPHSSLHFCCCKDAMCFYVCDVVKIAHTMHGQSDEGKRT